MQKAHLLSILLLFLLSFSCSNSRLGVNSPTAEAIENSLGLALTELNFSWEVPTSAGTQTAYQILVASSAKVLSGEVGDLWDSGKRFSSEHVNIAYRGIGVEPGTTLWWKVKIWGEDGKEGAFCSATSIRTADSKMNSNQLILLGGTLISNMEKYGFFETSISTYWGQQDITLRNLGWPGDDVFGTARSQFGSAQNTKSWQPPSAEDGFGFEVLKEQIAANDPATIIVGYGAEVAFADDETAMQLFEAGYTQLLNALDSIGATLILLSPTRQESAKNGNPDVVAANQRLEKATQFIQELAKERNYTFVNLFDQLITAESDAILTENGIHLNEEGYRRMTQILLKQLTPMDTEGMQLRFSETGQLLESSLAVVEKFDTTGRGARFNVQADALFTSAKIDAPGKFLLKIDGQIYDQLEDAATIDSFPDALQYEALRQAIIEKNRLHRYRLNPLNSAYIFLFRRHEMGHLAYEMDDFDRLVEEQEERIALLRKAKTHLYEIELHSAWAAPREYPDHEVPKNIPEPNVEAELNAFTVADGFQVNLFAADPMIANPIYMTWDTKGRAWVSTSSTYPHIKPGQEPNDKIIILEDTDGDGQADKSTVFAEGLFVPHSVMPVEGGAYVCASTEFLFLPDEDGDDKADEVRVVYGGFGNADVHHMIHGLRWSPWGDLFFTQAIYINSFIDTPHGNRRLNGSGIWQFRPETERLEIFSTGMVNPWGHAFDAYGQAFGTDGAGGSGPHYVFPNVAHPTSVGAERVLSGLIPGKPKNTAAEFISSRHFPASWQGDLISNDFRANRTVRYKLKESGSGYTAEELETVLHSSHRSYRPVDLKMGPDGALYVVDWYNPIIDHGEVDFHHPSRDRSHGRIWRVTNKNKPVLKRPQVAGTSINALLDLLKSPEAYTRLQANRELVMQNCSEEALINWAKRQSSYAPNYDKYMLEAAWLSQALNYNSPELLAKPLASSDHHIRAAGVRMIDPNTVDMALLSKLMQDKHPQVRLEAVHVARKVGSLESVSLALKALDQPMDDNLDFAIWQTAKKLQNQWLPLAQEGKSLFEGKVDHLAFALLAANNETAMRVLIPFVKAGKLNDADTQKTFEMIAALGAAEEIDLVLAEAAEKENKRLLQALVNAPSSNTAVPNNTTLLGELLDHENQDIRSLATRLVGRWKVSGQKEAIIERVANANLSHGERLGLADALIQLGDSTSIQKMAQEHSDLSVRSTATAAWAKSNQKGAVANAIDILAKTTSIDDANTLYSAFTRSEHGPLILAEALEGKTLNNSIAIAGNRAVQSSGRDLPELVEALNKAGDLKTIGIELNETQRAELLAEVVENGSVARGAKIYHRESLLCTSCHMLDNKGGKIGPDLSSVGAYMTPESLLESILNPGTDIKQGYETVNLTYKNGTILSGTLHRKTGSATLIRDAKGDIISVDNSDIQNLETSPVSLMPAGLTAQLRQDELVDLMRFLTNLGKS